MNDAYIEYMELLSEEEKRMEKYPMPTDHRQEVLLVSNIISAKRLVKKMRALSGK